jgi:hypothetical protein
MNSKIKTMQRKIVLLNLFMAVCFAVYSQPKLSISYTDDNGARSCDQNVACACNFTLPVTFGSKEVLLSRNIDLTIKNTGSGNLIVNSIVIGGTNGVHWSFTSDPTPFTVSGTKTISISFHPQDIASLPLGVNLGATLTIATNADPSINCFEDSDPASANTLEVKFNLNGQAKKTVVNYSLIFDRSGSMSTIECGTQRIENLRISANMFFDLAKLRKENPSQSFTGDKIGIVKFDDVAEEYITSTVVTDAFVTDTKNNKLNAAAVTPPSGGISPRGSTGIGNAVILSINNQLPVLADPNRKNVAIVFTDGYENVSPYTYETPVTNLLTARQDVNIYTIGIGDADDAILQTLSSNSGLATPQYYGFPNYSTTCDPYMLGNFFFKIYKNAVGESSATDPTYYVDLTDTTSRVIGSTWLTSADRKATFIVFDPPAYRKFYKLEVLSPTGEKLSASPLSSGLKVIQIADLNYTIYEVDLTGATSSSSYVGKWDLKIYPMNATPGVVAGSKENRLDLTNVPIGFTVSALSNLTMVTNVIVANYVPGNELLIAAEFLESGIPIKNVVSIEAIVQMPSGSTITLTPTLDSFGKFVSRYPHTFESGTYKITINAKVKNSKGEVSTREDTKYIALRNQKIPSHPKDDCLSCRFIKIILAVAVLLLLLILILALRRKK